MKCLDRIDSLCEFWGSHGQRIADNGTILSGNIDAYAKEYYQLILYT